MTQTRRAAHGSSRVTRLAIVLVLWNPTAVAFLTTRPRTQKDPFQHGVGAASKGTGGGFGASNSKNKIPTNKKRKVSSKDTSRPTGTTFVKAEQEDLLAKLAQKAATTAIGRAVAQAPPPLPGVPRDPFWEFMPSLISSKFPQVPDHQLERVAGMIRHTLDSNLPLEDDIVDNPHRPHGDIHAYMPGLGPTQAFHDPDPIPFCQALTANYDTIRLEYQALVEDMEKDGGHDRFQSVTSMNYDSGWKTLVLFYNGHRIDGFPYHLCPTTTRLLETMPLAGRIAGFNRQQPRSGIPKHTDGNNMWLTCQMGIQVPEGKPFCTS